MKPLVDLKNQIKHSVESLEKIICVIVKYNDGIFKAIIQDELDRDKIALYGVKCYDKGNMIVNNMKTSEK